jgi:hypothetical protein
MPERVTILITDENGKPCAGMPIDAMKHIGRVAASYLHVPLRQVGMMPGNGAMGWTFAKMAPRKRGELAEDVSFQMTVGYQVTAEVPRG